MSESVVVCQVSVSGLSHGINYDVGTTRFLYENIARLSQTGQSSPFRCIGAEETEGREEP
jgi:hypothetical protein